MNNSQPAELIIAAMKGLLNSRKQGQIKRIKFLKVWGSLRAMLTATPEYQAWRRAVKERAGGACEQCGEIGAHSHHKKQISYRLDLVFDLANGEFLCFRCHSQQPNHHLRRARHSRAATGRAAARPAISSRETAERAAKRRAQQETRDSALATARRASVSNWLNRSAS